MNRLAFLASEGSFNIMAYVVDIILIVIALIFMIVCAKKGFVACLFGLVATILAIVGAVYFASFAVETTGGLFGLKDVFIEWFTESFSKLNGFDVVVDGEADIAELLSSQDMSAVLANLIASNFVEVPEGYTLGMLAGETVGGYAALLTSGIALYIIFRILLAILKKFFNSITKDGLLGALNKLLGAAVGLLEALILVSLAVAVCAMFPSLMGFLNGSIILTWIYNVNPLMWLIGLVMMI